jgi:hypothetical protein
MRYLLGIAIWTAALSAATATARIVAFLSGADPLAPILSVAEVAAIVGVALLLLGAFAVYLLTQRQLKLAPWGVRGDLPAGDWAACLHRRREVLDQRLRIDEPHLCSQYLIACTCWSFCAGSKGKGALGEDTSPAPGRIIRVCDLLPQTQALPLVQRNGMDSCPFRFASPFARRVPAYAVALNSFESGTAAR